MESDFRITTVYVNKDKWIKLKMLALKKEVPTHLLFSEGMDYVINKYSQE
jgi:hypothetical protein